MRGLKILLNYLKNRLLITKKIIEKVSEKLSQIARIEKEAYEVLKTLIK